MKRRALFLAVFLMFLASAAPAAQSNFSKTSSEPSTPLAAPLKTYTPGEKLVFDVYWMGLHVGFGTIEVKEVVELNGRKAFHVVAVAETNETLSKIYPVRDEIHSWIDAENFHSLQFRKVLREGRYRADEQITFDYEKKKGLYESFLNHEKKEVDIPVPVHDIVSAFYWFRLQSVEPGKSVRTIANSEEKNQEIEIQVLRRERKELRGRGVIDSLLVEPRTRIQGVLYSRGRSWIHFTADERRIPFSILLKTPYGPVIGVLRRESLTPPSTEV
jgi:hypothetical protein